MMSKMQELFIISNIIIFIVFIFAIITSHRFYVYQNKTLFVEFISPGGIHTDKKSYKCYKYSVNYHKYSSLIIYQCGDGWINKRIQINYPPGYLIKTRWKLT